MLILRRTDSVWRLVLSASTGTLSFLVPLRTAAELACLGCIHRPSVTTPSQLSFAQWEAPTGNPKWGQQKAPACSSPLSQSWACCISFGTVLPLNVPWTSGCGQWSEPLGSENIIFCFSFSLRMWQLPESSSFKNQRKYFYRVFLFYHCINNFLHLF